MGDITEIVVAIAFSLPEVYAVLLFFLWSVGKEILDKVQHDHFAQFKFKVFSRQEHLVIRYVCNNALLVLWQRIVDINPVQFEKNLVLRYTY